jgi:DNA-binding response OmpR family regulator
LEHGDAELLSADTGVAERTRASALGVAGFVTKPFDPVVPVALLSGVIERAAVA